MSIIIRKKLQKSFGVKNMDYKVGLVGVGFVGSAIKRSFESKGLDVVAYDKYKNMDRFEDLIGCDMLFLNLPTPMIRGGAYDKGPIFETLDRLEDSDFSGVVILKSTVEPGTVWNLNSKYSFFVIHNPEFLTERTAYEDFHNQTHVVLGIDNQCDQTLSVVDFFSRFYPEAEISLCSSKESEAMKIFCNNFYAMKIMIFNEFFDLCSKMNMNYQNIVDLMVKNDWINPMHTMVPGPDGKLAYGGNCFIKDTEALLEFMKRKDSICKVLEACVSERNMLRSDSNNVRER